MYNSSCSALTLTLTLTSTLTLDTNPNPTGKVMHNSSFSQSFMGTGGFLAPELRYAKSYSKPVDVWALGVTLYVMLSGFLPFDAGIDPPSQGDRYTVCFPEHQWGDVSRLRIPSFEVAHCGQLSLPRNLCADLESCDL